MMLHAGRIVIRANSRDDRETRCHFMEAIEDRIRIVPEDADQGQDGFALLAVESFMIEQGHLGLS